METSGLNRCRRTRTRSLLSFVYVERTPLFRFPDVINAQFLDSGNGTSTLILHSASVYGLDDLGKNRERVEDLLKRTSAPAAPPSTTLLTARPTSV